MRSVLNQYSFVLLGLLLLAIAAAVTARVRRRWQRAAIPGGLLAGLVVAFLLLRTGGGNVRSAADLDRALAGGRPVMLELYSDYWVACLAAKPVVDGLEQDLGDQAVFLRANLGSAVGEELGARYGVTGVPSVLAFDRRGKLVLQHNGARLPVAQLRRILSATE